MTEPIKIRFGGNELSGAFADIGADLPLLIGMILAAGLDTASVFIAYGLMLICTAVLYRLPMPVQPLKAVAVIVISQKVGSNILLGAGLAIGITMFLLAKTGLIEWMARIVPKSVVRGVQFGLGLQLASLALKDYVPSESTLGYWLAGVTFVLTLALLGNRRLPAALVIVLLGAVYALVFKLDFKPVTNGFGFRLSHLHVPKLADIWVGFLLLALPQIPLSLGNSILATAQTAAELFPGCIMNPRRVGLTFAVMNLVNPFLGGIPTGHGSGGMKSHYTFGARTGGSVAIYGMVYLVFGLFFSRGATQLIQVFPLPMLGVLLVFEALALLLLARDTLGSKQDFAIVLLVGLMANGLPYGYLYGLVGGTAIHYLLPRLSSEAFQNV